MIALEFTVSWMCEVAWFTISNSILDFHWVSAHNEFEGLRGSIQTPATETQMLTLLQKSACDGSKG